MKKAIVLSAILALIMSMSACGKSTASTSVTVTGTSVAKVNSSAAGAKAEAKTTTAMDSQATTKADKSTTEVGSETVTTIAKTITGVDSQETTKVTTSATADAKATTTVAETEKGDPTIEILSTSISKDSEDKPVLVVEYKYTNNSDEAKSFTFACNDKAFQNAVECDSWIMGCDDIDSDQQSTNVKPNMSYVLKVGYRLADTTTPVEIKVTDVFENVTFLTQTIKLPK